MIVGPDFVWVHFPKCAGTETTKVLEALCARRTDIVFDPHMREDVIWHHSVSQRESHDPAFRLAGRRVICNIRRLPAWLLSRIQYEYRRSPRLPVSREMFLAGNYVHLNGQVQHADDAFAAMTAPAVDAWIRSEHLEEDLERVFSAHLDMSAVNWRRHLRGRNVTEAYIREPAFYFTGQELAGLYAANPLWAAAEERAYGGLTRLDAPAEWNPAPRKARSDLGAGRKGRSVGSAIRAEWRRFKRRFGSRKGSGAR